MINAITLTVSQLNEYVKALLDSSDILGNIYIKGEISGFKNHYKSGHLYFSLKDDSSLLKAVMFRQSAIKLKFMPEDGMRVIVRGRISVFPRDGVYQMYAEEITPDGVGEPYLAFEQMKERLLFEGLFNEEYKKTIPRFPEKIGIVTGAESAAVADMKNIITRRYPVAQIIIYPSLVQGSTAPTELASGIRYFNTKCPVDTIIIGRGGGSIEDLWAFNSELLAREIFASNIPVISAVGHETDYTICDFVSDMRAPTPSAAAELCVPDSNEILSHLQSYSYSLKTLAESLVSERRSELTVLSKNPMFQSPLNYTERLQKKLTGLSDVIRGSIANKVTAKRSELSEKTARLSALSPLSVMSRGYSIVYNDNGKAVSDISELSVGSKVQIKLNKGSANAEITDIVKGADKNACKKEN